MNREELRTSRNDLIAKFKKELVEKAATTLEELEAGRAFNQAVWKVGDWAWDVEDLVWSILHDSEVEDKSGAIVNLANEFAMKVGEIMSEFLSNTDKSETPLPPSPENPDNGKDGGVRIWKSGDKYMWLSAYSNSFEDTDNEIITADSHRNFVKMVDAGEWGMPDLWLEHRPEWNIGKATFVAVDELAPDVVIAMAGGYIHQSDAHNNIAKALMDMGDIPVSHGMPPQFVDRVYDPATRTVIYKSHKTVEISALPVSSPANKVAGFAILKETSDMAIPAEKREQMVKQLDIALPDLEGIEQSNLDKAQGAIEEGMQYKSETKPVDTHVPAEPVTPAEPTETAEPVEKQETPAEPVGDLAQLTKAVGELVQAVTVIGKTTTERFAELEARLEKAEAAQTEPAEKPVEKAETPMAGQLFSQIMAATGTIVKSEGAPSGDELGQPTQPVTPDTQAETPAFASITGIPVVDAFMGMQKPSSQAVMTTDQFQQFVLGQIPVQVS